MITLGIDSPREPTPAGMRGTTLYAHQQAILHKLLCLESESVENTIVLAEPFGSGKTLIIIALIVKKQLPDVRAAVFPVSPGNKIIVRYKCELVMPALVVVGGAVLSQWEEAIATHTDLRCLVLANSRNFTEHGPTLRSCDLNIYNIILVKCAYVTQSGNKVHTIDLLESLVGRRCYSRVVFDDCDMLPLRRGSKRPRALSTIYVSATIGGGCMRRKLEDCSISAAVNTVKMSLETIGDIPRECQGVKSGMRLIDDSVQLPMINSFVYMRTNTNASFIKMVDILNGSDKGALNEMLNSDAILTAAESVGMKTASVGEIFRRVLMNQYDNYVRAQEAIVALTSKLEVANDKQQVEEELESERAILADARKRLDRVIENAKEDDCPVCRLPLSEGNVFIMHCCGILLCDNCGVRGSNLRKRDNTVMGSCTNCKAIVKIPDGMTLIDKQFNISALINADYTCASASGSEKVTTVVDIVLARAIDARPFDLAVYGLIVGQVDIPNFEEPSKVVIYAPYDETLCNVAAALDANNISYLVLRTGKVKDTLRSFREDPKVKALLINSKVNCAGINLEFASDLIVVTTSNEVAVSSQIIGRVQRIGRKNNARVHMLKYNCE